MTLLASTCPIGMLYTLLLQAQAKADGPAQPASPRQARKPAEAQQAKHALQNMAASLKRAYDEGRLRERKPAPATAVGESLDASFGFILCSQVMLDSTHAFGRQ